MPRTRGPAAVPSSVSSSSTVQPSHSSAPASTAAFTRIASSTMRRGAYASRTPSAAGIVPVTVNGPTSSAAVVIAGHPDATSSSSSPQRFSAATPGCHTRWVDSRRSLGNVLRSTSSTRCPLRASSMAVDAPAHRAPTTITSYIGILLLGRRPSRRRGAERAVSC